MKRKMLGVVAAVATVAAMLAANCVSFFIMYQPKVPKSMQK